jgi:hypothetical protein
MQATREREELSFQDAHSTTRQNRDFGTFFTLRGSTTPSEAIARLDDDLRERKHLQYVARIHALEKDFETIYTCVCLR